MCLHARTLANLHARMYVCMYERMYVSRRIYGQTGVNGIISLARQGAIPSVIHSMEDLLQLLHILRLRLKMSVQGI